MFQLSASDRDDDDPKGLGLETRGRTLIKRGRTYDGLIRDFYRGWMFSATELTEKYTLDDLKADRPDADIVVEIRPDRSLVFPGYNREPRGGPGSIIVSFGPPELKREALEAEARIPVQDAPDVPDLPKA